MFATPLKKRVKIMGMLFIQYFLFGGTGNLLMLVIFLAGFADIYKLYSSKSLAVMTIRKTRVINQTLVELATPEQCPH